MDRTKKGVKAGKGQRATNQFWWMEDVGIADSGKREGRDLTPTRVYFCREVASLSPLPAPPYLRRDRSSRPPLAELTNGIRYPGPRRGKWAEPAEEPRPAAPPSGIGPASFRFPAGILANPPRHPRAGYPSLMT